MEYNFYLFLNDAAQWLCIAAIVGYFIGTNDHEGRWGK